MGIFKNNTAKEDILTKGYFFEHLPRNLKLGYNAVASGISSFKKKIEVPEIKSKDDMKRILEAVLYDNPLICYVDPRVYTLVSKYHSYDLFVNYVYDKKKSLQIMESVNAAADSIISCFITDNMTDYEKSVAVHDYLTENIRYNFSAITTGIGYDAFTAEGALLKHQAVCEGIAKAMSLVLKKAGVFCIIIQGMSNIGNDDMGHAWNIVRLGKEYYHIDATWDLQEVNHFTSRSHMYVNLDDESILMNHVWELDDYPLCNSKAENYYVKEKRYFRTMYSFNLFVRKFLNTKLTYMDIRFEDTLEIPDDNGKMLSDIIMKISKNLGISLQIEYLFNVCTYIFQAKIEYI